MVGDPLSPRRAVHGIPFLIKRSKLYENIYI
nr:MAG TPA: hypothetical protein [Caudoviricetes sp.]DAX55271.1 MAG TPA: hypothetical protein [Caudoviricetes sp.]